MASTSRTSEEASETVNTTATDPQHFRSLQSVVALALNLSYFGMQRVRFLSNYLLLFSQLRERIFPGFKLSRKAIAIALVGVFARVHVARNELCISQLCSHIHL
jgi:hypothetical protein